MNGEGCQVCGAEAEFSLEPDDGSEILACAGHLGFIADRLFGGRLASGEMRLYDLVRR